jgi:hypothetical protein
MKIGMVDELVHIFVLRVFFIGINRIEQFLSFAKIVKHFKQMFTIGVFSLSYVFNQQIAPLVFLFYLKASR